MAEPYQHPTFEPEIVAAIERVASWPAGKRRKLLLEHVEARHLGSPLCLVQGKTAALPAYQWAEVVACAAFEPHGVWVLGVRYIAAPSGCQDCALANWNGDSVSGCSWTWEGERGSKHRKPSRFWTWPGRYLARVTEEGKRLPNGHILTEDLHYQCSRFQRTE